MNEMQYQPKSYLQTLEERQMGMWLHLSHLANLIFFPVGMILPVVIWQTQKDKMPALDEHGKSAVNWIISSTIYHLINLVFVVIGIILTFVFVGIFVLFINFLVFLAISIASIAFSIIAALKANEGEHWEYPATIKFLK